MCGTCTPAAPRSITSTISCAVLDLGRTMGVTPLDSAAMIMSSTVSSVMVPCSQSISTQSKPRPPAISTSCGEGIITESPKAGLPAANLAFIAFGRIEDLHSPHLDPLAQHLPDRRRVKQAAVAKPANRSCVQNYPITLCRAHSRKRVRRRPAQHDLPVAVGRHLPAGHDVALQRVQVGIGALHGAAFVEAAAGGGGEQLLGGELR